MVRYYIVFKGRVQGVGFRYTLCMLGDRYNLTGSCRNLDNGDVDCEVQGEKANINAFLKQATAPQRFIDVEDYSLKEIPVVPNEKGFRARYF